MITDPIRLELDKPVEAGTQFGRDMIGSLLMTITAELGHKEAAQFWAGMMAALSGHMAAHLGADDAEAIMISITTNVRAACAAVDAEDKARAH